ncbi:DUF1579 domain-containing protein [bacterium]|nr:MAG: DUF1579 domain-containing protein [bacterium]
MAVPKRLHEAVGQWNGKSQLHLPFLPPEKRVTESASRLHIETGAHDAFATITYTWETEGERQEGTMLVCMAPESETGKTKAVQIGWVDSWHQNSAVMHLVGHESETGAVKAKGAFTAGGETWGWTIAFDLTGDELALTMENLTPSGEAEWAVRATYRRD